MGDSLLLALVIAQWVLLLGVLAFVSAKRSQNPQERDPRSDLANMTILFQTMRDIVQQQKDLARQMNESLDRKVGLIRQVAAAAMENLDRLGEVERKVLAELEEARVEVAGLRKEAACLRAPAPLSAQIPSSPPASVAAPSAQTAGCPVAPSVPERDSQKPSSHMQSVGQSRELDEDDPLDLIDNWVGFDFLEEAAPAEDADDESDVDLSLGQDGDGDGRDAFRALLGLDTPEPVEPPRRTSGTNGGNGRPVVSVPAQARVYEFHDAGMTVTQIAQEMGIGKGEVRLILNLRQEKGT